MLEKNKKLSFDRFVARNSSIILILLFVGYPKNKQTGNRTTKNIYLNKEQIDEYLDKQKSAPYVLR